MPDAGVGVGDAAAAFLSGAYAFDKTNAGVNPYQLPATQSATLYVSWDAVYLYFFGSMKDPGAATDTGPPQIEMMACAGDPDSNYDEKQCVDFIVSFMGDLSGPARFDTSASSIKVTVAGIATAFTVTGRVPASQFGTLFSGKHMAVNMNAISYQQPAGAPPSVRSSMSAFFVPGRTCGHDGDGGFKCGGGDQSYEPVRWARMVLQ